MFSVGAEGTLINDIDIHSETGGRNAALIKTLSVDVSDGQLDLVFAPLVEKPLINGIETLSGLQMPTLPGMDQPHARCGRRWHGRRLEW